MTVVPIRKWKDTPPPHTPLQPRLSAGFSIIVTSTINKSRHQSSGRRRHVRHSAVGGGGAADGVVSAAGQPSHWARFNYWPALALARCTCFVKQVSAPASVIFCPPPLLWKNTRWHGAARVSRHLTFHPASHWGVSRARGWGRVCRKECVCGGGVCVGQMPELKAWCYSCQRRWCLHVMHFHAAPPTSVVLLDDGLQIQTSSKGSWLCLRLTAILTGSYLSLQLGKLGISDSSPVKLTLQEQNINRKTIAGFALCDTQNEALPPYEYFIFCCNFMKQSNFFFFLSMFISKWPLKKYWYVLKKRNVQFVSSLLFVLDI